jgi:hypothetical protein
MRTRENTWQRRDTAQRTPEDVQKTSGNPTDMTTHPQTPLLTSTHATRPTPQLGHTRTNTTKVAPGGASKEIEQREKRETEVRKEKTEKKLDWAEEVEREYEQHPHPQPTAPRPLVSQDKRHPTMEKLTTPRTPHAAPRIHSVRWHPFHTRHTLQHTHGLVTDSNRITHSTRTGTAFLHG